jgi:hypothetical protein
LSLNAQYFIYTITAVPDELLCAQCLTNLARWFSFNNFDWQRARGFALSMPAAYIKNWSEEESRGKAVPTKAAHQWLCQMPKRLEMVCCHDIQRGTRPRMVAPFQQPY